MRYNILTARSRRLLATPVLRSNFQKPQSGVIFGRNRASPIAHLLMYHLGSTIKGMQTMFAPSGKLWFASLRESVSPLIGDDGTCWGEVFARMVALMGSPIEQHVVYYPAQIMRQRVYVYCKTAAGNDLFAKVEYGATSGGLENECRFFKTWASNQQSFKIPSLLAAVFEPSYRLLVQSAIPAGYRTNARPWETFPFRARNQLIGVVRRTSPDHLSWMPKLNMLNSVAAHRIRALVRQWVTLPHPVGLAHGDFSLSNIFYKGADMVVVDWEAASFDAPFLVDEVSYRISQVQQRVITEPVAVIISAVADILRCADPGLKRERTDSVLLSLAFLVCQGHNEAQLLSKALDHQIVEKLYEL